MGEGGGAGAGGGGGHKFGVFFNGFFPFQEFIFLGGEEDILEIEIRNKFSGTRPAFSRYLGKLSVSLSDIFEIGNNRLVNYLLH